MVDFLQLEVRIIKVKKNYRRNHAFRDRFRDEVDRGLTLLIKNASINERIYNEFSEILASTNHLENIGFEASEWFQKNQEAAAFFHGDND